MGEKFYFYADNMCVLEVDSDGKAVGEPVKFDGLRSIECVESSCENEKASANAKIDEIRSIVEQEPISLTVTVKGFWNRLKYRRMIKKLGLCKRRKRKRLW